MVTNGYLPNLCVCVCGCVCACDCLCVLWMCVCVCEWVCVCVSSVLFSFLAREKERDIKIQRMCVWLRERDKP